MERYRQDAATAVDGIVATITTGASVDRAGESETHSYDEFAWVRRSDLWTPARVRSLERLRRTFHISLTGLRAQDKDRREVTGSLRAYVPIDIRTFPLR
jgi:hypothetical protein